MMVFTYNKERLIKCGILVFVFLIFTRVYITYFRHPPADALLRMNRQTLYLEEGRNFAASNFAKKTRGKQKSEDYLKDEDIEDQDKDNDDREIMHSYKHAVENEVQGYKYWNNFLKSHSYVAVGAVYSKCEGLRKQLGTIIMEEDKEIGGVKLTTFVKMTIEKKIQHGQVFIDVKYNGKGLYDNYWELCEVEGNFQVENRTFTCPIPPGNFNKVRATHIPNFLPRGQYQVKTWALDDTEKVIGCAFLEFRL